MHPARAEPRAEALPIGIIILRGFVYLNRVTMATMVTMLTTVTMITTVTTVTMATMVNMVTMITMVTQRRSMDKKLPQTVYIFNTYRELL